jgi:hypothetical protein
MIAQAMRAIESPLARRLRRILDGDFYEGRQRRKRVRHHRLRFDEQASESLPAQAARETKMKNQLTKPKLEKKTKQKLPAGWEGLRQAPLRRPRRKK